MSEFNLRDKIENWDKKEIVRFSLFCCHKVRHLMNKESLKVVKLVERWLEDETSVSEEELGRATDCAHNATRIAYYTAHAAYYNDYTFSAYYATHYTAKALISSKEALYLEYMRGRLSDIMEN